MKKTILSLLIITTTICSPDISIAINRGAIRDFIRIKVRDTGPHVNQYYWSDTRLNNYIDLSQNNIARETDCIKKRMYLTTVNGQATYTIVTSTTIWAAANPLKIYRVYLETTTSGKYKMLKRTTVDKLEESDTWENDPSGTPYDWYELFVSTWATSVIKIGLDPAPNSSYAGSNKLRIDLSHLPETMTSDSDVPFNNNPRLYGYHELIIYDVSAMCMEDIVDTDARDYYRGLYKLGIDQMKTDLEEKPARRGGITVEK